MGKPLRSGFFCLTFPKDIVLYLLSVTKDKQTVNRKEKSIFCFVSVFINIRHVLAGAEMFIQVKTFQCKIFLNSIS